MFLYKKFHFGILEAVLRSSILKKFRQSSIRKEHVCLSILLRYQLKRRKRRKRVVLKNREIFRDNNLRSLFENIKLYSDIVSNSGPVYVNESTEYCYLQGLLRTFALIVSEHPYCARKFACHVIHERVR